MRTLHDPAKLTLRLERDVIEAAKRFAEARGTSVSRLVEDFFRTVALPEQAERPAGWKEALPPLTRSLLGIAAGADVSEEDYRRHLEGKYLG